MVSDEDDLASDLTLDLVSDFALDEDDLALDFGFR